MLPTVNPLHLEEWLAVLAVACVLLDLLSASRISGDQGLVTR
jgi:hypothetical protein